MYQYYYPPKASSFLFHWLSLIPMDIMQGLLWWYIKQSTWWSSQSWSCIV